MSNWRPLALCPPRFEALAVTQGAAGKRGHDPDPRKHDHRGEL